MTRNATEPKGPAGPRERQYPTRCVECGAKAASPTRIRHTVEKNHDGRLYRLDIAKLSVIKCASCGELYFDKDSDEQIARALRDELGLLHPDQIRGQLGNLGLEQKEFANALGVAPETVSRWLNGALIQSRAMDNLLRVFIAVPEARAFLQRRPPDVKGRAGAA